MISKPLNCFWHPQQQIAYTCDVIFAESHWLFILCSAFLKSKGRNEITLNQQKQMMRIEIRYRI